MGIILTTLGKKYTLSSLYEIATKLPRLVVITNEKENIIYY